MDKSDTSAGENSKYKSSELSLLWTLVLAGAMIAAMPVFYLLSLGPLIGLSTRGYISQEATDFYAGPARRWIAPYSLLGNVMSRYVQIWTPSRSP
jgi:hypothetical protein